jgi:hypothetical protein
MLVHDHPLMEHQVGVSLQRAKEVVKNEQGLIK